MARIRSRGNQATELALAKLLRKNKITGWRRHVQVRVVGRARSHLRAGRLPAKRGAHGVTRPTFRVRPDFVFVKSRTAVFVDGCFWHGCPRHGTKPKGNAAFWRRKFAGNKQRDARVTQTLRRAGWRVLRVWKHTLRCAVKEPQNGARLLRRIQRALGKKM